MGGSFPGWATDEWFRGVENTPQSIEGSELVSEYAIDDVWSAFTFTAEESDMLASVGTDLGKYLDESRSAFITGQLPLSERSEERRVGKECRRGGGRGKEEEEQR